jgi:hypothetical protein
MNSAGQVELDAGLAAHGEFAKCTSFAKSRLPPPAKNRQPPKGRGTTTWTEQAGCA